ncbi:MAG: serine/threonine-protein kinase [Polyangia bacterium]
MAAAAAVASEPNAGITQLDAPQLIGGRFSVRGSAQTNEVGTVFSAVDTQHRDAAVRVVVASTAALPSPALADRALREWKQLAKVTTPRIVRIVDQGKFDDGTVFVVSDVPAGITLDELVAKDGPLALDRIKEIVRQVGEALSEAQKVGVIHRDVAPRNIHVDGSNVTVGEFGLAEAVSDKVFGSPAFLSPEQAEGKPVDQRSNIYSLGAVIYYMLTGKAPFEGNAESLLAQHIAGTPPHPSVARPSVPAELDRIVAKALEKSGGRRHLTLRQLITEVESVSAGASVVRAAELGTAATLVPEPARALPPGATVMGMPSPFIAASRAAQPAPATELPAVPLESSERDERKTAAVDVPVFEDEEAKKTAIHDVPVFETRAADGGSEAPAIVDATPMPVMAPVAPAPVLPPVATKPVEVHAIAAAVGPTNKNEKAGAGFRETAWFKKGEIEEEIAKAEARSASEDPLAPTGITGQHAVVDAGVSVSSQDHNRLSLKTGATQMMAVVKGSGSAPALPGERMNEAEMLDEMNGGTRGRRIAGVVAGVILVGVILYFAIHKAEPEVAPLAAPTSQNTPVVAPPPAPVAPPQKVQRTALDEAKVAAANGDYALTVDALLRASRDGSDGAQVTALAAATHATLVQASLDAMHRHDAAASQSARALAAKIHGLLSPAPAKGNPAKHTTRIATRKR